MAAEQRAEPEQEQEPEQEHRVAVASKKQVTELVERHKAALRRAVAGQDGVPEELRRQLEQELLANFEAAVQVNVLVKGLTWEEAPDDEVEEEALDLESVLDDAIVETSRRRCSYPKRILPHVVHALKAERKIMGLYEDAVKPQEVLKDPQQERTMQELSAAAPAMVKQAIQVIKSINTLQTQVGGLCQVLSMKPSQASLDIHSTVFPCAATAAAARPKQPLRRAAERAAASEGYEPLAKKRESAAQGEQSQ